MTDPRTYRDMIDQLAYHLGSATDERNQSQVRMAIRNAYRDLVQKRNWNFFWRENRLFLNAPYTTGTVQYTQSNLTVTLTGGTWPSWVNAYSRIRIGIVTSQVASVPNSTTLILDPVYNFGSDIAAGSTFVIYQNLFPLPSDFRAMGNPIGEASWWSANYVTPEAWLQLERSYGGTINGGVPLAWTIFGDFNNMNGLMMGLWPWPSVAKTYDFVYQAAARPILRHGMSTTDQAGTVSGTSGTPTVTGTGTTWVSGQAGSVIRFGDTTNIPTGPEGLFPYQEQATIKSVDSATQFTLTSNLVGNYTNVKYIVSDPINLPEKLITALIRRSELEIADLKDRGSYDAANSRWIKSYLEAGEADQVNLSPQFANITAIPTRPPLRYAPYVLPT